MYISIMIHSIGYNKHIVTEHSLEEPIYFQLLERTRVPQRICLALNYLLAMFFFLLWIVMIVLIGQPLKKHALI
jgi:hypothetical protein